MAQAFFSRKDGTNIERKMEKDNILLQTAVNRN